MDGNDTIGDCTIAALAHAITVYRGLLKTEKIIPQAAVEKLYCHLTGGPDTGLNYWRANAVAADEILAYVKIDAKNHTHIEQGMQIFGGGYLGFQVQEDGIQEFDNRQPWTPGPLLNEGHAVYALGYDGNGVTVLTWGTRSKAAGRSGTSAWMKRTPSCLPRRKSQDLQRASISRNCKRT